MNTNNNDIQYSKTTTSQILPDAISASPIDIKMKNTALIVHVLYAAGLFTGVTPIIGLIIAYLKRDDARGTIFESHLTYAIRTFWIGMGMLLAGLILSIVLVGFIVWLLSGVWYLVRVVRALLAVLDDRPIANPKGFF